MFPSQKNLDDIQQQKAFPHFTAGKREREGREERKTKEGKGKRKVGSGKEERE